MSALTRPYEEARAAKGLWGSSRFLILRRISQLTVLALFLTGPAFGFWITKGTLASSMTLDVLPMTDLFVFLQTLATGHLPETTAIAGAAVVLGLYLVFGGRTFCAWACPINPVTDLAGLLRRRFDIGAGAKLRPQMRMWLAGAALVVSAATGMIAWELVNPITALHRALVFGLGFGLFGVGAIFLFDLFVAKHGWCGHICPVGACYGAVGRAAVLRVSAARRDACDDCMSCFAVCPEPHVITPALRGGRTGATPVIRSGDCTVCAACIDVCPENVFRLAHRFDHRVEAVRSTDSGPRPSANAPSPLNRSSS